MPQTDPPLSSMTGFGTAHGHASLPSGRHVPWAWELRGVNGRGLDLRLRMPPGFDALDAPLRQRAAALGRGTIQAGLTIDLGDQPLTMTVDDAALRAVADAITKVNLAVECSPPTADGILALKGVLNVADDRLSVEDHTALLPIFTTGFDTALANFAAARATEGARMGAVLSDQLDQIAALTQSARDMTQDAVAQHLEGLKTQVAQLLADSALPADRLAQEAVLIAVRTDIREEVDRLDGHVAAAKEHMTQGGIVGRKLDFLGQEFVREANTLTTKAPTLALKRIGLELKGVIDQFKEQVQNIA